MSSLGSLRGRLINSTASLLAISDSSHIGTQGTLAKKRLSELRKLERELLRLVARCGEARAGECCPTLELLENAGTTTSLRSRAKHVTSNRTDAS